MVSSFNYHYLGYFSISLTVLAVCPNDLAFIVYLVIYATGVTIISLLSETILANKSNDLLIKFNKEEFHLILETILGVSRISGYLVLLIIGIFNQISLLKFLLFFSIIPFTLLMIYIMKNIDSVEN